METNEPVLQPFDEIFPRNYVQNTTERDMPIPFEEILALLFLQRKITFRVELMPIIFQFLIFILNLIC
ncbi:hypothetical protein CEXT_744941 [Caerostris extrusa]|uniref:Uncharacterized protein n=1 Tax=Caerostris extrusa TaxID=172846 RepID=A0AAV4X8N4_CAEEX|nr:hypothetical protein CEXT_744941 [Caerostris extrusa]